MISNIILPSKPKVISETEFKAVYEIDGLFPGYGHTIGNSLRRIILSSLPGAAVTSVKIEGVSHEFSTIEGVKEDVINILLNLKMVRFRMTTEEPQKVTLKISGPKKVTAKDFKTPGQVEVMNPEQFVCEVTTKMTLEMELTIERGLGYLSKEMLHKDKVEVGTIALDAIFTPIRRVNYEVENMRVGDRTDYNRLRLAIETDGILTPREAFEKSLQMLLAQLGAIASFTSSSPESETKEELTPVSKHNSEEILKNRVEDLGLSARTANALAAASIRTVGGLVRKSEKDISEIEGMGDRALEEIKDVLAKMSLALR
ncbi:MAG: DNA-directed RNA polymerase subunit alpha [Patescibacteria group bacterium]